MPVVIKVPYEECRYNVSSPPKDDDSNRTYLIEVCEWHDIPKSANTANLPHDIQSKDSGSKWANIIRLTTVQGGKNV